MGRRKQLDVEKDAPKVGSNSNLTSQEAEKLRGYVQEIERVEVELKALNDERAEIYASLKESGFDTKAVKHIVKLRKLADHEREAFEHAVEAYQLAFNFSAAA